MITLVIVAALMILAGCLSIFIGILFGVRWRRKTKIIEEGEHYEEEYEDLHIDFIDISDRFYRDNNAAQRIELIPVRRNHRAD